MSNVTILIIFIKVLTFFLALVVGGVLFFMDFLGCIGVFYFVVLFVVVRRLPLASHVFPLIVILYLQTKRTYFNSINQINIINL